MGKMSMAAPGAMGDQPAAEGQPEPSDSPTTPLPRPKPRRDTTLARLRNWQSRNRWLDHSVRTIQRYHNDRIEYFALKVVSRGLFLAVSVMLVFLFVFDRTTSLIPGINEITIPTMSLPDNQDLGAVVHVTFEQTRGDLLGVIGGFTLLVSAVFTAKALRNGTIRVLAPRRAGHVSILQIRNLFIGLGVAVVLLISWLLAFATAIRSAAIRTMAGSEIADPVIHVGKAMVIVLAWALLTATIYFAVRRKAEDRSSGTVLFATGVFATVIVAANFVLLYSYIAALFDSDSSGGVVLILTLLAWVNTVARGFFMTECWIVEAKPLRAGDPNPEGEAVQPAAPTQAGVSPRTGEGDYW